MRVTPRRLVVVLVLLVGALLGSTAQRGTARFAALAFAQSRQPEPAPAQAPGQQGEPQPTFRAGINYVAVDVIVTDRQDAPIIDLRKEDF